MIKRELLVISLIGQLNKVIKSLDYGICVCIRLADNQERIGLCFAKENFSWGDGKFVFAIHTEPGLKKPVSCPPLTVGRCVDERN